VELLKEKLLIVFEDLLIFLSSFDFTRFTQFPHRDTGSGGRAAVFLDQESHQLLRAVWGREELGEHRNFPAMEASHCTAA